MQQSESRASIPKNKYSEHRIAARRSHAIRSQRYSEQTTTSTSNKWNMVHSAAAVLFVALFALVLIVAREAAGTSPTASCLASK
jgi:hypothetical protein